MNTPIIAPSSRFASDPLQSLPPEVRALIYAQLNSDDCLKLQKTSHYHACLDAELWRKSMRPYRNMPFNALEMWATWDDRETQSATQRMQSMRDAAVQSANGVPPKLKYLDHTAYSVALVITRTALGCLVGRFLTERVAADDKVGTAFGLLGASCVVSLPVLLRQLATAVAQQQSTRRDTAARQEALARYAALPQVPASLPPLASFNLPMEPLSAWLGATLPLLIPESNTLSLSREIRAGLSSDEECVKKRERERFLFNTLRLPIPIHEALKSNRPELIARSLCQEPYVNAGQLRPVLRHARRAYSFAYRYDMVKLALKRTPRREFERVMHPDDDESWRNWTRHDGDAEVLDLLLRKLTRRDRSLLINHNDAGNSMFHRVAASGKVEVFRVLLAHGGDLDNPGATPRQIAEFDPMRVTIRSYSKFDHAFCSQS